MWLARGAIFIWFCALGAILQAQETTSICKTITTWDTPIVLDSLTVLPESLSFFPPEVERHYQLDLSSNQITIFDRGWDSVRVCFRTLPYDLHSSRARKTLAIYDSTALFKDAIRFQQQLALPEKEEVVSTENIYKTGSISRGVSFGNRQDVFVNSTLNLQMEGQLTENVNLRAVITDRNVPFQPEGNTQQIQDFDNVFIELYNDKFMLKGGDVVLESGSSRFLKYYKNVQGAQLNTRYQMGNGFQAETTLAGSVAKGRFASVSIEPLEGVLGPYRVRGPNNERFIIILAGSEKVYIDGELMIRGFDKDYVIDYNLAEITFTNRVLITQFTRIRVDYEFSDQNYSRAIFQAVHEMKNDDSYFNFNYYNEKDNRNQPLAFDLSTEEKRTLASVGDDLNNALTTRADSVNFSPDLILYKKTVYLDPQIGGIEIFEYSTNSDSAFFDVRFTEVGVGNGNYELRNATANGRIYDFVPPVNGQAQGRFEPVSVLNAPNQKSMVTLAGGVKLNETDEISTEVAFSKNDVNLFSDKDAEDDTGFALHFQHETKDRNLAFAPKYRFSSRLSYEFNSESFSFIDRVRYIEFDRDWSLNRQEFNTLFSENIFNARLQAQKDNFNDLSYELTRRKRGEAVDGFQHNFLVKQRWGNIQAQVDGFLMNNDQPLLSSSWNRINTDISYRGNWLIPGIRLRRDRNEVSNALNNEVVRSAMHFDELGFYLKNSDSLNTNYGVTFQRRTDRIPFNGEIRDETFSNTWNFLFNTAIGNTQTIDVVFTYRNLEKLQAASPEEDDRTIMGRIDWVGSFFDRVVQSELSYSLANSRELRREFIFIQVPTGEGTHTWRDDNGDGVQDLSEFYIAVNPDEKNYVKIFVPTDTFEEAFNTLISYRLDVNLPSEWSEASGLKKTLSYFSTVTAWNLNAKITDEDLGTRLWPIGVSDQDVLGWNENLRSTLFFNRTNARFGADVGLTQRSNKQLLSNGFEERQAEDIRWHARWNVKRGLSLDINFLEVLRQSASNVLSQRNYRVMGTTFNPTLNWQPDSQLRLTAAYNLKDKQDELNEGSTSSARLNEWSIGARYSKAVSTNITANFKFIDIDFEGVETSPVGYELLEALRPGSNMTWNINWQQKLGNGLQLLLRYDGRKSGDSDTIHLGRVQVTALF